MDTKGEREEWDELGDWIDVYTLLITLDKIVSNEN